MVKHGIIRTFYFDVFSTREFLLQSRIAVENYRFVIAEFTLMEMGSVDVIPANRSTQSLDF